MYWTSQINSEAQWKVADGRQSINIYFYSMEKRKLFPDMEIFFGGILFKVLQYDFIIIITK